MPAPVPSTAVWGQTKTVRTTGSAMNMTAPTHLFKRDSSFMPIRNARYSNTLTHAVADNGS